MFEAYIKRPLVIKAIKWDGNEKTLNLIRQQAEGVYIEDGNLIIPTLEGDMRANVGDYVIIGLRGESYPCKPDIFHKSYIKVDESITHECAGCLYFSIQYRITYIPYLNKIEESRKPACSFGGKTRTIPTRYRTPLWCPIKP